MYAQQQMNIHEQLVQLHTQSMNLHNTLYRIQQNILEIINIRMGMSSSNSTNIQNIHTTIPSGMAGTGHTQPTNITRNIETTESTNACRERDRALDGCNINLNEQVFESDDLSTSSNVTTASSYYTHISDETPIYNISNNCDLFSNESPYHTPVRTRSETSHADNMHESVSNVDDSASRLNTQTEQSQHNSPHSSIAHMFGSDTDMEDMNRGLRHLIQNMTHTTMNQLNTVVGSGLVINAQIPNFNTSSEQSDSASASSTGAPLHPPGLSEAEAQRMLFESDMSNHGIVLSHENGRQVVRFDVAQLLGSLINSIATETQPEHAAYVPTETEVRTRTRTLEFGCVNNPQNDTCPISMDKFRPNDDVMQIISCGHIFSTSELQNWLQRSVICPMCRHDIRIPIRSDITIGDSTELPGAVEDLLRAAASINDANTPRT